MWESFFSKFETFSRQIFTFTIYLLLFIYRGFNNGTGGGHAAATPAPAARCSYPEIFFANIWKIKSDSFKFLKGKLQLCFFGVGTQSPRSDTPICEVEILFWHEHDIYHELLKSSLTLNILKIRIIRFMTSFETFQSFNNCKLFVVENIWKLENIWVQNLRHRSGRGRLLPCLVSYWASCRGRGASSEHGWPL